MQAPSGNHRFEWRADREIYRIKTILGENTYETESVLGSKAPGNRTINKISGSLLVKLDMPEFEVGLQANMNKRLEVLSPDGDTWHKGTVERLSVDGRVLIRFDDRPDVGQWLDLTSKRYRWLIGEEPPRG